jgi:ribosomal protein S18 acetylase RimI-like enzyme
VWALADGAGYRAGGWLETQSHRLTMDGEIFLAPGADPAGVELLLDKVLTAAAADKAQRPVHLYTGAANIERAELYERHGGSLVRHFFRMTIALDGPQVAPDWPEGVMLTACRDTDDDLRVIHHVIGTAFEDHWGHVTAPYDGWQQRHRSREDFDPSLWWIVRRDGEPVAAAVCSQQEHEGYVGAIGVLREARGLGLARRLLGQAFTEFAHRGLSKAALAVDSTNPTGAVRLYESVGMTVATRWACYEFPPA